MLNNSNAGVDIGGTFTDLVWLDPITEKFIVNKILSNKENPSIAVEEVLNGQGYNDYFTIENIQKLIHGTTLVTNSIIERKGSKTALITTEGFKDILYIARQRRYDMYNLNISVHKQLIPRHLCLGAKERTLADGTIHKTLNSDDMEKMANKIRNLGIESVGICFLHSYKNDTNERRLHDYLKNIFPNLHISLSCEVAPEIGEYERTSTTVANAYVKPNVKSYLEQLETKLKRNGFKGSLHIMLASGGSTNPTTAAKFPIRLIESGPAAGALAAAAMGRSRKDEDLLSFDMGGTTAKMCLIENGYPLIRSDFETDRMEKFKKGSGLPVKTRTVDMIEIGAGGGSIAHKDEDFQILKVGPQSAGSTPGPVAYDRGGKEPTVTDADLIIGFLNPDYFLGGEMTLDKSEAKKSLTTLGSSLNYDCLKTAAGIYKIVNENMAAAARVHAIERGKNPRDLPLYAFGGAGPIHAYGVAKLLGSPSIVIPDKAGVFSAFGLLSAPIAFDYYNSVQMKLDNIKWTKINNLINEMKDECMENIDSTIDFTNLTTEIICEMCYEGQSHTVKISCPLPPYDNKTAQVFKKRFEKEYLNKYNRICEGVPIKVLTWGVRVSSHLSEIPVRKKANKGTNPEKGERIIYWPEINKKVKTTIYERDLLQSSSIINGPGIIEEKESTIVVGPDAVARVDKMNNVIIEMRDNNGKN